MKWRPVRHVLRLLVAASCIGLARPSAADVQLVIATVDNGQMRQLQALGTEFERANPGVHLRWVTLDEKTLRRVVSADLTTQGGQFDVVTIGNYEAAIWPRRGWLKPLMPEADYDVADLLPTIRNSLSYRGALYALPLYGESSILMYRKDLVRKAGLTIPAVPTWQQIAGFAARLDDRAHDVHGICLRGQPGWGINMTLLTPMVNAFGGQWFDMQWRPQLQTRAWREAAHLYVSLLRNYGPPDAASKGYNENLRLFQEGKCAMWVDATVAAAFVTNPALSRTAGEVGFAAAPVGLTARGSQWLWSWAFAIPADVEGPREALARRFVAWASSRQYVRLVASRLGWRMVPSGTRASTYAEPDFRRAAPWAAYEREAIRRADQQHATLPSSPYVGVQFAAIPAFPVIGDAVGRNIAEAVSGRLSVEEALERSQHSAERWIREEEGAW